MRFQRPVPSSPLPLSQIKQRQDEEKKQLCSLRDQLRPALQLDQKEVGPGATGHSHSVLQVWLLQSARTFHISMGTL